MSRRRDFRGPIRATAGTIELARLVLLDSGRLQEEFAKRENRWERRHPEKAAAEDLRDQATFEAAIELAEAGARGEAPTGAAAAFQAHRREVVDDAPTGAPTGASVPPTGASVVPTGASVAPNGAPVSPNGAAAAHAAAAAPGAHVPTTVEPAGGGSDGRPRAAAPRRRARPGRGSRRAALHRGRRHRVAPPVPADPVRPGGGGRARHPRDLLRRRPHPGLRDRAPAGRRSGGRPRACPRLLRRPGAPRHPDHQRPHTDGRRGLCPVRVHLRRARARATAEALRILTETVQLGGQARRCAPRPGVRDRAHARSWSGSSTASSRRGPFAALPLYLEFAHGHPGHRRLPAPRRILRRHDPEAPRIRRDPARLPEAAHRARHGRVTGDCARSAAVHDRGRRNGTLPGAASSDTSGT